MDKFLKRIEPWKCRWWTESKWKIQEVQCKLFKVKPQCLVCCVMLPAESMKPSKLIRHLGAKHSSLKALNDQKTWGFKVTRDNTFTLEASYPVSWEFQSVWIAHTVTEHAAVNMVKAVIGSEDAKQLKAILLSSNIVSRKMDKMADDFTAIQLDTSR
jgi:hypothetical protein